MENLSEIIYKVYVVFANKKLKYMYLWNSMLTC